MVYLGAQLNTLASHVSTNPVPREPSLMIATRSNSVVYATTTAYEYYAAVVTDDFFQGANWTTYARSPIQYANPNVLATEWVTWLEDTQQGRLL